MNKILLTGLIVMPLITSHAFAAKNVGEQNSVADIVINKAIDSGKIIPCDSPDSNCKGMGMQYSAFYSPDKKTAIVWTFGFPTEGTAHIGKFSEFKDENGWKFVKNYEKPLSDYPAPKKEDIQFHGNTVSVKYKFKKRSDPNRGSTGNGVSNLKL